MLPVFLLNLDFYLLGFRFLPLRQSEAQHSVLELRVDCFGVDVRRERERSVELTVAALDAMIVLTLLFVFHPAFAAYRKRVLIEAHLYIVSVNLR